MTASFDALIDQLVAARREGRTVDAGPFAEVLASTDSAYRVHRGVAERLGWFGPGVPPVWKSGGPSRAVPLGHSALPPAGVWRSPAAVGAFPLTLGGAEGEIALRLGEDVDAKRAADLDLDGACLLVDAMAVSIELVDSRWQQGLAAPALLKLADLQCHGALVLGDWVPFERRDWSAQRCRVTLGDRGTTDHVGTHALGDPAWVLPQWLRHVTAGGQVVPAGTVVTTGTWCGLVPTVKGERVTVAFDGIGQATLTA